MINLMKL